MLREDEAPALGPKGGRPKNLSDAQVSSPQERRDAGAMLARLKRDRPDLADQAVVVSAARDAHR